MDNRISLPNGYKLTIQCQGSIDTIRISEEIGRGGNCIVYRGEKVTCVNKNDIISSVVVKEFYPVGINIKRLLPDADLVISDIDQFERIKEHFGEGQVRHVHFYDYYMDQTLPRMFLYGNANNTVYAVSDPGKGRTLSQINHDVLSLNKIASIMESICSAIRKMHIKKNLYLDCKPDNFFFYGNDNDLQLKVYLFDFDTVVSVSDIQNGRSDFCSASFGWVPFEQEMIKDSVTGSIRYRDPALIGYHTDIYSIGAVFFWLLVHRKPTNSDLAKIQDGSFDCEKESKYCSGVETEVVNIIQEILQNSLNPDTEQRKECFRHYISINNVLEQYQKLYGLTVGDNVHFEPIHREIKEIKQSLKELIPGYGEGKAKDEIHISQRENHLLLIELPHYRAEYSRELESGSLEVVAEKIARRILNGECFRLELDGQILPILNRIIYNRKEYKPERKDGMVRIPKGSVIVGGPSRTRDYPIKVDFISYDYWIDETPVTIAQYRRYLDEAGEVNVYGHEMEPLGKSHYPSPDTNYGITGPRLYVDNFGDPEFDDYPVTFVDWWDAFAYAKWAGKELPLEIEWEKAARGIDGRIYPFGNVYDSQRCNTDESNIGELTSVRTYVQGVSPYGCYDMSGNVWEWCADDFYKDQPNMLKVVKGGSFRRGQNKAMTFACQPREPMERWVARGFRCVRRINENE